MHYLSDMPSSIETQYECLAELREIEQRIYLVERDALAIPDELKRKDSEILHKRQALDSAKALFQENEKKLRAAERDLKEKEDALFKAEGKMMEVKTNAEYLAATKENLIQKDAKSAMEDGVLQLITSLEEIKSKVAVIEADFKKDEAVLLAEKTKLNAEHQELLKTLSTLQEKRKGLTAQLDPATAAMFNKLVAMKKGVAITQTENGRCLGCNMAVRAQIYNEVLGRKTVHRCPNCGKILITSKRILETDGVTA